MTTLQEKTYTLLQKVPRGRVTTYKTLARALGTRGYRAIGQFMRTNPNAPTVPCHRVVSSDGTIGGYMGHKNGKEVEKKIRMLRSEGVKITGKKLVNFERILYSF